MNTSNQFLFGIYPYVCPVVSFLGSLMCFDRKQYTQKSDSNELLHRGQLRLGSVLFHAGVLTMFFGHLSGLLTPLWFWEFIGVSRQVRQITTMAVDGIFGLAVLAGLIALTRHRFKIEHINVNSTWRDRLVLVWLLMTLLLGLSTIFVSMEYLNGEEMAKLMQWVWYTVTFRGGTAPYLEDVNFLFKMHIFMDTTFFFIFPLTYVVHVWSGSASIFYIDRTWQPVCRR